MEYTPHALASLFSPKDLIRQYVICQRLSLIPEGWKKEPLGEFWLGVHPDLPVHHANSSQGKLKVCFLGYVIDPSRGKYNRPCLDDYTKMMDSFEELEAYLHGLGGRYICIASEGESSRVYLDASGSMSLLFDGTQGIGASSLMLIPYQEEIDDAFVLIDMLKLHQKNGLYPFGLTPRKRVRRVLPNHYLCLKSWKTKRYWPTAPFERTIPHSDLVKQVADVLSKTMTTILKQDLKPYMSLTAGVDSRSLLACTELEDRGCIRYFTWELPDGIAKRDVDLAKQLTHSNGLQYKSYPFKDARVDDQMKWLYRTSLSIGELRGQSITTTVSEMDTDQPYIAGNVSLITLGMYWQDGDDKLTTLTGSSLLQRLNMLEEASLLEAAEQWLAGLPDLTIREILDLLYLEQRVGCWASEIGSGHADGPFNLFPLSNRKIFECSLQAQSSQEERSEKKLLIDVIRMKDPKLLQWPFNGKQYE